MVPPLFVVTNHQLWYPVDSPLGSIVHERPQSSSSDLHRLRNLSQHAVVAVNSCDVHREVRYSPEMFSLCVMSHLRTCRPSIQFLQVIFSSCKRVIRSVSDVVSFFDLLSAFNTADIISDSIRVAISSSSRLANSHLDHMILDGIGSIFVAYASVRVQLSQLHVSIDQSSE